MRFVTMIVAGLAAGCANPIEVRASRNPSGSFEGLRTYGWVPRPESGDPRLDDEALEERVHAAVAAEMAARGYVPAEAPDLRVRYQVVLRDETRVSEFSDGLETVEQIRRVGNRLEGEITLYDPEVLVRPVRARMRWELDKETRPELRPTYNTCTDTNGPASVYSIEKYLQWLKAYAPAAAQGMTFSESGPVPSQGEVAQQMFTYTAFTADFVKPGLPVVNEDGTPKWRFAPSPHGVYWKDGMKLGYQDAGSWTLLKSTPDDRAKAAWLYAQFVTSKTVDVKKSHVGLTFIRQSTLDHKSFTDRAPKLGGLIEFYRSPARLQWSPTGTNVPDYPKLAQLWWQAIGDASSGAKTAQEAMDSLCAEQEKVLSRLERSGVQGDIGPKLAEEHDLEFWNKDAVSKGNLAPQLKIENEKEKPQTVNYDDLVKSWQK